MDYSNTLLIALSTDWEVLRLKCFLFVDVYDINTDLSQCRMVEGIRGSILMENENSQQDLISNIEIQGEALTAIWLVF